jgi:hypothetical protein
MKKTGEQGASCKLEAAVFVTINPSLNLHPERAFPYPLPVVHVLSVRKKMNLTRGTNALHYTHEGRSRESKS